MYRYILVEALCIVASYTYLSRSSYILILAIGTGSRQGGVQRYHYHLPLPQPASSSGHQPASSRIGASQQAASSSQPAAARSASARRTQITAAVSYNIEYRI